jgi:hypothetical protein
LGQKQREHGDERGAQQQQWNFTQLEAFEAMAFGSFEKAEAADFDGFSRSPAQQMNGDWHGDGQQRNQPKGG